MNSSLSDTIEEITHHSEKFEAEEGHLTLETLLTICVLIIYTISSSLFKTYDFHYLLGSGICMVIGILVALFSIIINPESNFAVDLRFNQEVFFTFILPPIIFAAAYTIQRKLFFKYLHYILILSVFGTIFNFLIIAVMSYLVNSFQLFFSDEGVVELSITEIFLFAAAISATNTDAASSFINDDTDSKLSTILFGEGIVNDAVCIVLYRILKRFTDSGKEFMGYTPLIIGSQFIYLFVCSTVVGFLGGMLCAWFLKKLKFINMNRVQEICVIIFFAFITYTLTQEISLSPILSLLFAGIALSQYAYYNISFEAREQSCIVAKIMSNVAEAFVYTYLGLTFFYTVKKRFSLSFIIWEFIFIVVGRWLSLYGVNYIMQSILKLSNFHMKQSDIIVMSFCGSIRGSISFGLAISIDTPNREILISATLVLVFVSTLLFGVGMPKFFNHYNLKLTETPQERENSAGLLKKKIPAKEFSFKFINPNVRQDDSLGAENQEEATQGIPQKIADYWKWLNEEYIKPKLICDFPNCIEEDEELNKGIKGVLKNSSEKQSPGDPKPTAKSSSKTVKMDETEGEGQTAQGN